MTLQLVPLTESLPTSQPSWCALWAGLGAFWASVYLSVSFHPHLPGAFSLQRERPSSISNHATGELGSSVLQMTDSWRQASILDQSGKEHPCRPEPQTEIHRMYFICTSELNMRCQINQQLRETGLNMGLTAQCEFMSWHLSHVTCPFTALPPTLPPHPVQSQPRLFLRVGWPQNLSV